MRKQPVAGVTLIHTEIQLQYFGRFLRASMYLNGRLLLSQPFSITGASFEYCQQQQRVLCVARANRRIEIRKEEEIK